MDLFGSVGVFLPYRKLHKALNLYGLWQKCRRAQPAQTVDKKLFSPEGGRIALSANERIAEFLNIAIQAKLAYVNKLGRAQLAFLYRQT